MDCTVTDTPLADLDTDLLVVPLPADPEAEALDALATALGDVVRRGAADFSGEVGASVTIYPDAAGVRRAVLVGYGPADDVDAEAVREAADAGAAVARRREAETVAVHVPALEGGTDPTLDAAATAQALVEGLHLGSYRFLEHKTDDTLHAGPTALQLRPDDALDADAVETGARRGAAFAAATCTTRDLVNRSPDRKTAPKFAEAVVASGEAHGYDVEVWDEARITREGMGGLLAVNRGSVDPPRFAILEWSPDEALTERPVVLVGKGVVFDTGGLSLKGTKDSMDAMKCDMAGAGAVVGAFEAIADLDLPVRVVGLLPMSDNRPGGNAYVPGDVLTMHSGASVEVLNTDAEGRLLLADALSYAKSYDPELVVDLATLTGGAVVALGYEAAAVMTSETDHAHERLYALQRAGERSGDRVHPLPMYAAYKKQLDSDVADLKNVGGRDASAITAGKFLEHFVDYPWLHIDLAGPAFLKREKPYRPKGGTGFGVRLLATFLDNYVRPRLDAGR